MLFVMLFFVFTNAVSINLKKRNDPFPSITPIAQGQPCGGVGDDGLCATGICRIKAEDTGKCQISDEREIDEPCPLTAACKAGLECGKDGFCQSKAADIGAPTQASATPAPTSINA
ncbi:3447_t:CDS:1 [Gigaspora rosea]|nr:3447_t:CDS:1 [Gigaspora rosea]